MHSLYSRHCSFSDKCLHEHYCAKSACSEIHFCVGFTTLNSPVIKISLITLNASYAIVRCYDERRQRPPCEHAEGLCSVTMSCDTDYECAELLPYVRLFYLEYESTSCQCIKRRVEIKLKPCSNDDMCENEEIFCKILRRDRRFVYLVI